MRNIIIVWVAIPVFLLGMLLGASLTEKPDHRHVWGMWSDPVAGEVSYIWGSKMGTVVQIRVCEICKRVQVEKLKQ